MLSTFTNSKKKGTKHFMQRLNKRLFQSHNKHRNALNHCQEKLQTLCPLSPNWNVSYLQGRESQPTSYSVFSAKSSLNLMCRTATDYRRNESIISKAIKSLRNYVRWCTLVKTLKLTCIVWKTQLMSVALLPTCLLFFFFLVLEKLQHFVPPK